jgi:hypothetical protein
MHELSLVDDTFRKEGTNHCHLSIQADLNGFSFCIYHTGYQKHLVFRKYRYSSVLVYENAFRHLDEIFSVDDLLSLPYASSGFMLLTQKSTLIPDACYVKTQQESYLEFNHILDSSDNIYHNYLPFIDSHLVFALNRSIALNIETYIQGIRYYHHAFPFLYKILEVHAGKQKQSITVNLNHQFFDLAVTGNGKLKLYNTFQYSSPTDLLYYILFICREFSIEPGKAEVFLSGELCDAMNYYDAIREYLPEVQFLPAGNENLTSALVKIKEHRFLTLFNLVHCV